MKTTFYSLRKSRHILKSTYKLFVKQKKKLTAEKASYIESQLRELEKAIQEKNQEKASLIANDIEQFSASNFKKNYLEYGIELIFALIFALLIATVIRQVWFELYEIPSGSMRPTFEEQDRLTVTKTPFGINVPLMTKHFYFDPSLVQRTSVVIWSGDGVPHLDSDSMFMGVIPYTKRYIKRTIGKPGDTLYFYGGQIYGMDSENKELLELRNSPWMTRLDYVPFIRFEGRTSYVQEPKQTFTSQVIFHLMNQPLGRLNLHKGIVRGEVKNGNEWIKDEPEAQRTPHTTIRTYSDFFGIRNYAMARILNKKQAEEAHIVSLDQLKEGILYLELRHTPSLAYPEPIIERFGVFINGFSTLIPLQEHHLKAIMDNMYTARFVVKDGRADRYRQEGAQHFTSSSPLFPNVPDGTYEFYFGKAYQIGFGGIPSELPKDHPLYKLTPNHIQKLFNVGIEVTNEVMPNSKNQIFFPSRYAYFRNGDLYLMGGKVFAKDDPILDSFNKNELEREKASTSSKPYVAFKDYGAPLKEGAIDIDFLHTFGYKVPEGKYLVLGDNHAMSQDSRFFGPIPQNNLQGAPSIIFWPPSERWGFPAQKPYPLITVPRIIVWSIVFLIALISYLIYRRNKNRSLFPK